jgi:3-oxoadipate enol-lactonase
MPFVAVRDLDLFYELRGSGPRLLHLAGTTADLRRRPNVFDSPLAEVCEILAFDQRGLGQSGRPDRPYTMADYAADAAALMDAVGWRRCAVFGVSFGGMVAQELALRHPDRVDRLALAGAGSGGEGGASYPLHELLDLPIEEQARRWVTLGDTRYDADWQASHPQELRGLVEIATMNLRFGDGEPGRELGAMRQLEARRAHDTWERLTELRQPVLICGGRYDGICPPALLEALHGRLPDSELVFFEGGHSFLVQDPRAYERIAAFLTGAG